MGLPWCSRDTDTSGIDMKALVIGCAACAFWLGPAMPASAQAMGPAADPVAILVGRLDVERYKATIKGLTQFGDRLEGTDRNRAAIDWIEAQLKSCGCAPERHQYVKMPPAPPQQTAAVKPAPMIASGEVRTAGIAHTNITGLHRGQLLSPSCPPAFGLDGLLTLTRPRSQPTGDTRSRLLSPTTRCSSSTQETQGAPTPPSTGP